MTQLRAWDFAHGFCEVKTRGESDDCPDEEDLELMQYTGLKDKNGKEIYEGDILADENKLSIASVEWHEGFGAWSWRWGMDWGEIDSIVLEVIGNIYENSNLLK